MQADGTSAYALLQSLLPPAPPVTPPASHRAQGFWPIGLRSLSQVIFINHPLSGALLLLAFWLNSPWMALLALTGTAGANASSILWGLAPGLRQQGIHGFNGTLVGCAAAVLGGAGAQSQPLLWLLLVWLAGGCTTVMLELWHRRFHHRGDPPPLTLPFCLVTWGLLALVDPGVPEAMETVGSVAQGAVAAVPAHLLQVVAIGLPQSFGQVFLCSGLLSGTLVLLAVALASPLAAVLGLFGALLGMVTALLQGADPAAVAQGLWGYNGVLVAIAIAGIFHVPCRRSLIVAAAGAALTSPVQGLQQILLSGLAPLTLSFVLITWILQRAARRTLPALIPVCLHAVMTPEEHRRRFAVASDCLGSFRRNLRLRLMGQPPEPFAEPLAPPLVQQLEQLFAQLDRDHDGRLSVTELRQAIASGGGEVASADPGPSGPIDPMIAASLAAMDLDGDGGLDRWEFSQLIQRLQRLRQGEERLLLYLRPGDADGDDRLDPGELARLLRSIGQPPLSSDEQQLVFGTSGEKLSWRTFVDRLLLV